MPDCDVHGGPTKGGYTVTFKGNEPHVICWWCRSSSDLDLERFP